MSYMWYTFFGASVTIIVAHLLIVVFGFNDASTMDATLLAPFLRRFAFKKKGCLLNSTETNKNLNISKRAPLQSESAL